ncbi:MULTISPECIES: methyl-accepting chemotaxis protein [unclassified Roseateles]|uniref:methyl-accepting chemotaxis protein n=1 Tax=unclassified Roseateles TaxID=2626991 RepID=UPI0006FFC243|nr:MULTISPECIES: methyl-accepting chemotaxis protein [unclassified Roseateles]KQW44591.1 chemotaxis protein [Pelomonas sp. Root405]KRA69950.1 chemotaxis protein [Pelomonas sp. Root662]
MNNLKLSSRLALGFGLVLTLLAIVATIGISRMAQLNSQLEGIVNVNNAESRLAVAMRVAINQVATATRNIVLLTDEAAMKAEAERLQKSRADYDAAEQQLGKMFNDLAETSTEEKALFARIRELKETARPLINKVLELGLANKAEEATLALMKEAQPAQNAWLLALGELAKLEDDLSKKAAADAEAGYAIGRSLMLGASLVALLVGIVAAVVLTRSILKQLGGEPAYATDVVSRIAGGDLSVTVDVQAGDTTSLLAAMKRMQAALVEVVDNIRSGSDSIATGSGQIATGNADLSQRTEEQASNLQQTAASMEQLTSTVRNNADVARQATSLASSASTVAAKGGEVVGKVVHTMEEISASSKRISDIIGVIDGIAFQTNILALNAAVEAARAGEQGRGFAVVAGEVRTLASRSAEAAKEIKSLIGASVEKVENGTGLVAEAGRTMDDIVAQVRRVNDLIAEISAATVEQTSGIGQINDAVTQLDQVTQQNAALVEESAAAADSLRTQADLLVKAVATFKTADMGGRPQAAAPAARPAPARKAPTPVRAAAARPAKAAALADGDGWEEL